MADIWAGEQMVESPNVFMRLAKAVHKQFENADKLKKVIDNPHVPWSLQERNLLKPIVDNYHAIKKTETLVYQQLNQVEELLNNNQAVSDNLLLASQHQQNIKNQLQVIDAHLNQYQHLLESLSNTKGDFSDGEKQWQIQANEQVKELTALKKVLATELSALEVIQQACIDIVPDTVEKLESFLITNPTEAIAIPQNVSFLQQAMGDIFDVMTDLQENLNHMATQIRTLFTNLSDCIGNLTKTLDKTAVCLKQSEELLAQYPNAKLGLAIN